MPSTTMRDQKPGDPESKFSLRLTGTVERAAEHFAIDCHNTLTLRGKRRHEPLEGGAELVRVQQTEQPAERIVARQAFLELEEAAQKRLLRRREQCHVDRTLAAA